MLVLDPILSETATLTRYVSKHVKIGPNLPEIDTINPMSPKMKAVLEKE